MIGITSNNEFYVNKPPIWTAYCVFGLTWFFSEMLAVPLKAHKIILRKKPLKIFT